MQNEVPQQLLEYLSCPVCEDKPKVEHKYGGIYCKKCGRLYPIENGVLMMIEKKAIKPEVGGGDES